MKIFLGCVEIASVLSGLAEGFRSLGHPVTTFVFEKNKFYPEARYDIVYASSGTRISNFTRRLRLKRETPKWIQEFDLFIFIWRPWLEEEYLFKKIKQAGKKIICVHLGSDVRHISAYKQEFSEDVSLWEEFFHKEDLNEKIKKIRLHELYADVIYSVPDQAGLAIRPYNHLYLPIPNSNKIKCNIPARKEPLIVHAPSRTGIKGTPLIVETMNQLKAAGYSFTFEFIQNATNAELIKKLEDADILVDEVLLHGPGVLSAEAMFAGCAVATRTLESYKDIFNPPVVSITPKNLFNQLELLIKDISYRNAVAEKGNDFAKDYNQPIRVASGMIQNLTKTSVDYKPSFYLEKYQVPENFRITSSNRKLSNELAKKYYLGSALQQANHNGLI